MTGRKVRIKERLTTAGVDQERVEWVVDGEHAVIDGCFVVEEPDDGRAELWVVQLFEDGSSRALGVLSSFSSI